VADFIGDLLAAGFAGSAFISHRLDTAPSLSFNWDYGQCSL